MINRRKCFLCVSGSASEYTVTDRMQIFESAGLRLCTRIDFENVVAKNIFRSHILMNYIGFYINSHTMS